ncbi:MAG TPA: GAF domain-containing sensor histidine kinase, partial [Gemmatimonadales bacterium]|nr:GAF domain-containing sensor histidine kinase [Gemmatimonadales bacterium]
TLGGLFAVRRGRRLAERQRATLEAAISAAAARNRELELLRRLGSTLLGVRSSGELLEEVVQLAATLLQAEGSAIMLVAEEGRFLRIAAGAGILRAAAGSLLPIDKSLAGCAVLQDVSIVSDDMDRDPRNFAVDTLPPSLNRAVCLPLRTSGVVIGAACAYNRLDGKPFDEHDIALLGALGEQVAVGLDRATMLEETRRNERELAEKNRELLRVTKLKDEFLANMSHELRTPLNAIIGFSELLLMPGAGSLDEQQRDFLESIARNGRHLLGLINNILDLSKIEAGRMTVHLTRVDLRDSIQGAVTDTSSLRSAKRQTMSVDVGDEPLFVVADHIRVRQVLFNLLSNASKFTPEDGAVTLSALRTPVPLPIPADRAGDQPRLATRDAVWVTVRDSGIGIQAVDMKKLFQVFSQVDSSASRQQQGSGLGLALCKQFVEMHGGTIGAESVYGGGSTFWFILPVEGPIRQPG